jgi:hypothetical protein
MVEQIACWLVCNEFHMPRKIWSQFHFSCLMQAARETSKADYANWESAAMIVVICSRLYYCRNGWSLNRNSRATIVAKAMMAAIQDASSHRYILTQLSGGRRSALREAELHHFILSSNKPLVSSDNFDPTAMVKNSIAVPQAGSLWEPT